MQRGQVVIGALVIALGCGQASLGDRAQSDPDPAGAPLDCQADAECEPAGSSCCVCPTFALPASDGYRSACEEIDCAAPDGCPSTEAVCAAGSCVLRCAPIRCDAPCQSGFVADAFGCLTCVCAGSGEPDAPRCSEDAECVKVPGDCCGCAQGGADVAVLETEAARYLSDLGCDSQVTCPGVDVCDEEVVARCSAGRCVLARLTAPPDGGAEPPAAPRFCGGSADLPCPPGESCVLNLPSAPEATALGVGVCQPE